MNLEELKTNLKKNHNLNRSELEKIEEEIKKAKKDTKMYYGKLDELFEEICESKSLDKDELKHQIVKEFVEQHKDIISKKYYLKYYGDKDEILIYGDDGKYYELSDGSKINKRTFEKMFKSEQGGDLEINPHDFFNYGAINIKQNKKEIKENQYTEIDIGEFNKGSLYFAEKLKSFFDNIDTKNMKEPKSEKGVENAIKRNVKVKIKKPIYNNEPIKHDQNEEWKKSAKKKLKDERDRINEKQN